ncbi:MAG: CDP-alcohol phosphatidyltransferase family protein [Nanoarchaeota archaeon]
MNLSMKELRKRNNKDYYSLLSKTMHYLMLYVTKPLLRTNITPNQISVFWIILQLIASYLLIFGTYSLNLVGISLYTIAALFDYVDGQIARIKKISTYKGYYLEDLGIYFGQPIFLLCLGIGTARAFNNPIFFYMGVTSTIAILYRKLAVRPENYPEEKKKKILKILFNLGSRVKKSKMTNIYLIFRRSNPLNLLFLGLVFNIPRIVLIVYTLLYLLDMVRMLYVQLNTLHQLDLKNDLFK